MRVSADNISSPTLVTVDQTFTGLDEGEYLGSTIDGDVLLEQQYATYESGFERPQPLIWFELRRQASDAPLTINLSHLLTGKSPNDLTLSVLYYANEQDLPIMLDAYYDLSQLSITFTPAGEGRYLIEWSRPAPVSDSAGESGAGEPDVAAAAVTEPELPQGWTPTYHSPVVSEFNGSVSFNYPVLTPPGAAGLQPNLGLSYNSAIGNGMIGRLQGDEVGFGWNNTALIDITQSLATCHGTSICLGDDTDIDGNPDTYDPYNQYTLSYNGSGYDLIHSGGKAGNGLPGRYYAQGHAGLYIELCKSPFSAYCAFSGTGIDTQSDVFWRVKSADDTTYRLGYTINSEQQLIYPERAVNVANKALRWRVDTIIDRYDNVMTYTYVEDTYTGWIHSEYFHVPASYPTQISYDAYNIVFNYLGVPYDAYRTQGYGYVVSWQTQYLIEIVVKTGTQVIRRYALGQDFQRYGTDNDTDNLPLDPPVTNQSAWCSAFNWVLDFNDPNDADDNVKYTPDRMPTLRTIREVGSDNVNSRSSQADVTFTYNFLGTGLYDHASAPSHVKYCFPYLDSVETIYGPADQATPTTAYTWGATQQNYQANGSLPYMVLGRYANLVEQDATYSGFEADAPTQRVYFRYTGPDMQGYEGTYQGFGTVERCYDTPCTGAWLAKHTLTFLVKSFYAADKALASRVSTHEVYQAGGTRLARTENSWGMLDADGIGGADPSGVVVLNEQIQRDYRGATIKARTGYRYDVYGNQTEVREYGERTSDPPQRTLEFKYAVNTNVSGDLWLVNLPWRETLWDGAPNEGQANKIVRQTRNRYDGATCGNPGAAPTLGRLTAEDAYVPGFGVSCGGTDYNTTTFTYHATRKWQVTRVTDPAGRYQDYTWTDATRLGAASFKVGSDTYTTAYTYDSIFRWQVRQVTQPNGAKTRYSYDSHGRLDTIETPNASTGAVGTVASEYNYHDTENPFFVEEINEAVVGAPKTRTFYDAVGRPLQVRRFDLSSDFLTTVTDTEYDTFGRVVCVTTMLERTLQTFSASQDCYAQPRMLYTYDPLGEQVSQTGFDGATTSTAIVGRQRRVTNGAGHMTTYESDDLGRLKQVTQPVVGGVAPVMTYGYDLADNLLTATGPGGVVTTMAYDKLGRKLSINDPDMGFWSYDYDGSGNLVRQTDARDQRLCFYYDAANRPTSKRHDGTGASTCPTLLGGTLLANYTYHTSGAGKGMPASTTGGSGVGAFADTFTYDFRGRVTSYTRVIDGVTFNLSTTYDTADRVKTLTWANADGNEVVTYTYDGEFPDTLHSQKKGGNLVAGLTHNFRGQLTYIDRVGSGIEDTTLTYHDQNENFHLNQLNHGTSNDDIPDFHYEDYDALAQLRELNTLYSTGMAVSTFTYDGVGQMLTEQRSGDPSGVNYNYTYTYGAGGNIDKRKNETSGAVRNYVYDIDYIPIDGPHYHALESVTGDGLTATFTNDLNGNMTSRAMNGVTYTQAYDAENRLASVTVNGQTTAFYYDAGGNRTLTVQPNGTKVYTPFPEYEKTVPVTGSPTERNHYTLAGQLVAVRVKVAGQTGAFYYFYTDRQGSVHALRKADGTWVNGNYARYDAYGGYRTKPATTVNPGISDRGYTGHRMNNTGNDLGLIYMNARYYLPEVGRFISADTIVPDPKDPQSYNRYAYSNNNPINYVDPSGHDAVCSVADSNGNYSGDCNDWMTQAMVILGLEGGPDGVRLAALFWQWFNDPGKMLRINAFYVSGSSMFTRQLSADTATIGIDMNVVLDFKPNEIALLGHELEHVSQGTWQAWSIQGEVLAYQVEFRIREAMGIGQTSNTDGAMGRLGEINRKPYDAQSYKDLIEARFGFLGGEGEPYNVWFEPNLPWGQQILINSLAANKDVFVVDYSPWLTTLVDR